MKCGTMNSLFCHLCNYSPQMLDTGKFHKAVEDGRICIELHMARPASCRARNIRLVGEEKAPLCLLSHL